MIRQVLFAVVAAHCSISTGIAARISADWWSGQTSSLNVIEPPSMTGGVRLADRMSGNVEGTIALPSDANWKVRFSVQTDREFEVVNEFVRVFVNDELVRQVFNAPRGERIEWEYAVSGDRFDYRFDFRSSLDVLDAHLVVLPAEVTCADYMTGDADGDCQVNVDDFKILRSHFGEQGTRAQGDFTEDGRIDLKDFRVLKEHLFTSEVAVPEPATWLLMVVTLLTLGTFRAASGLRA